MGAPNGQAWAVGRTLSDNRLLDLPTFEALAASLSALHVANNSLTDLQFASDVHSQHNTLCVLYDTPPSPYYNYVILLEE